MLRMFTARGSLPLTRAWRGIGLVGPRRPMSTTEAPRLRRPNLTETEALTLNPAHFTSLLKAQGTDFFAGVPDSLLKDICAFIAERVPSHKHVICANEGTALALASGHHLATGRIPCVYLQNSGLGNAVNPLVSLCSDRVYAVPVLLLIGWRGEPGKKDEPQHMLQGSITPGLLKNMGVAHEILPNYAEGAFEAIERAYEHMHNKHAPYALLVSRQTFAPFALTSDFGAFSAPGMITREEMLRQVVDLFPACPLVTTTGFTSREVFELRAERKEAHDKDFLTVGSMGHCSSIALGVALAKLNSEVLCIDGDGAALMHMGAFATIGQLGLKNFKHVLVNNAIHDSVGGQPTGAQNVDFPAIAKACGYTEARMVSDGADVGPALKWLKEVKGPAFLEVRVVPGTREDLGRPTTSTLENKKAFMMMLAAL